MEEARIGTAEDDAEAAFGNVVDFAFDALGRVWVADAQRREIRVFDARGALAGRKGAGPGELALVAGMDWDAEGGPWVLAPGTRASPSTTPRGALVATHRRAATMAVQGSKKRARGPADACPPGPSSLPDPLLRRECRRPRRAARAAVAHHPPGGLGDEHVRVAEA